MSFSLNMEGIFVGLMGITFIFVMYMIFRPLLSETGSKDKYLFILLPVIFLFIAGLNSISIDKCNNLWETYIETEKLIDYHKWEKECN